MTLDRETLETEREFLLRSLDDLEAERADGNIDDGTYRTLHDDYTARAAAVIRSIDAGADLTAPQAPAPTGVMRWVTVGGIVAFAVVAAFLLTRAVGVRHPGQTITGNAQVGRVSDRTVALADAVKADPNNYDARVQYARWLLRQNDPKGALEQYDAAARIDPKHPEPLAYGGWIRGLVAQQAPGDNDRKLLGDAALQRIDAAIAADSKYADAYVFKGLVLLNVRNDPAGAIPALQQFLVLAPLDHPLRPQVLDVLGRATGAITTSTSTP